MTTNGGKRKGAGRKKGSKASHTLEAETFRKALIKAVLKDKQEIIQAFVDQAKKGNAKIFPELLNRVLGRVKEEIGISVDAEQIEEITVMVRKILTIKKKEDKKDKEDE